MCSCQKGQHFLYPGGLLRCLSGAGVLHTHAVSGSQGWSALDCCCVILLMFAVQRALKVR
jgi:hypothetical protein